MNMKCLEIPPTLSAGISAKIPPNLTAVKFHQIWDTHPETGWELFEDIINMEGFETS